MKLSNLSELKLECMAIGSLPQKNPDEAIEIVRQNFKNIPFWPQLTKKNKKEDMLIQFTEKMPSFSVCDKSGKAFLDSEADNFYENLEEFFNNYEEIVTAKNTEIIEEYCISDEYSSTFKKFIKLISETRPKFSKGQIVGPFTLATTLCDNNDKCAIYDETLCEIITKTLSIKALWQIKQIKQVSSDTIPIIFIDEPSISQVGSSAFVSVSKDTVISMIKEISDLIKENGGLSAIHCCGKCDWTIPILAGVNIINLDAYNFARNLSLYNSSINSFLINGGKIAWGIVPTLNEDIISKITVEELVKVFETSVKYLTEKGINEKLIIDNSIVTPSCGAGSLPETLACRAMNLTNDLSKALKTRYV